MPTTLLLPQVVDAVDIPVIAAGGFFDGRGLVAALAYGAAGIAMGTRFLLTRDSTVPDAVKQLYLARGDRHRGHPPGRRRAAPGAAHRLVDALERAGPVTPAAPGAAQRRAVQAAVRDVLAGADPRRPGHEARQGPDLAQVLMAANTPMLLRAAMVDGRPDLGVMASGQVVGVIDDLPSCEYLIDAIVTRAAAAIRDLDAHLPH